MMATLLIPTNLRKREVSPGKNGMTNVMWNLHKEKELPTLESFPRYNPKTKSEMPRLLTCVQTKPQTTFFVYWNSYYFLRTALTYSSLQDFSKIQERDP